MAEKVAEIVEKIKGLSLLEAAELKKALEEEPSESKRQQKKKKKKEAKANG